MAGYGGKNNGERATNRALRRIVQTNTRTAVFAFPRRSGRQRLGLGMSHRQHTAPRELEQQQETGYWAHGSRYNPHRPIGFHNTRHGPGETDSQDSNYAALWSSVVAGHPGPEARSDGGAGGMRMMALELVTS